MRILSAQVKQRVYLGGDMGVSICISVYFPIHCGS